MLKALQKLNKSNLYSSLEINRLIEENNKIYKFDRQNLAYLLANILHETSYFSCLEENLYYTTKERLRQVFPSKFKNKSDSYVLDFVKNKAKLGNLVYDGRFGNKIGDGYKYRGRGCLMTTFLNNYKELSNITQIDFVDNPDLLLRLDYAIKSSFVYYNEKIYKITKNPTLLFARQKIAGSKFGYTEVEKIFNKIKEILDN